MFDPKQLLEKRSSIMIIIVTTVGILISPILLPHLFHDSHGPHIALHAGAIVFAIFLALMGGLAYYRLRRKRLLLTFLAFVTFVAAEVVMLMDAIWPSILTMGELSFQEVGHLFILATLGILSAGIFRTD